MGWEEIIRHQPKYCRATHVEYTGLWPFVDTLPPVNHDSTFWGLILRAKGFTQKNGAVRKSKTQPRIIYERFKLRRCICTVQKVYTFKTQNAEDTHHLQVTEQLRCNGAPPSITPSRWERELENDHQHMDTHPHNELDERQLEKLKIRLGRMRLIK